MINKFFECITRVSSRSRNMDEVVSCLNHWASEKHTHWFMHINSRYVSTFNNGNIYIYIYNSAQQQ